MEFTEKEFKNLWSFIVESMEFTDEENAAIEHVIPMTQELFNSIIDKCNEIGSDVDPLFYRMLDEYKDFMCVYADKIEKEVEDVELPTLSEEQWEENKQKLYARIREKYGEDAI